MARDNLSGERLLKYLAAGARKDWELTVWQWLPGQCSGHAPDSLHYQTFRDGVGKAWDAYGSAWRMARFARALRRHHGPHLSEGIHRSRFPGCSLSIKDGRSVPSSYWGSAWAAHSGHVHVGIL